MVEANGLHCVFKHTECLLTEEFYFSSVLSFRMPSKYFIVLKNIHCMCILHYLLHIKTTLQLQDISVCLT